MASFFVLTCVGITCLAACVVAVRVFRCAMSDLNWALVRTCECMGLSALFLAANVVVQIIAVLAMQSLTRRFVSLHMVGDLTLVAFSVLQGVAFQWWRARQSDSARR